MLIRPLDAHVLVVSPKAGVGRAADLGRDVAILAPPAAHAIGRGERGIDGGGVGVEDEALLVLAHGMAPVVGNGWLHVGI